MGTEITLLDVFTKIAGIDSKLDAHVARVDERLDSGSRKLDDHEARMRTLEKAVPEKLEERLASQEKFRWQLGGALLALNFLAVLVEWYLWSHK